MLSRHAFQRIKNRLEDSPAVAILGPRQAGKTTLARSFDGEYFDLEDVQQRLRLDLEWDTLATGSRLVVLDEAQVWPELFPRLRGAIDGDRKRNGRFLLLGSVSPGLMTEVSQSLAGRLALVELTPFILTETGTDSLSNHWLVGGYPDGGILGGSHFPRWQLDYLELLIHRDLPSWGFPARPRVTDRLLRMLASLQGQRFNASQLAQSLGISAPTVTRYMDYLEGAYLLRRLPSFQANIRKRLTKSPKYYIRDSGLLHSLLGVRDRDTLLSTPSVGASFEGYVIEQLLSTLQLTDLRAEPFHFRTSDQHEIDLVLKQAGETWAIEIKLTTQPSVHDMRRLRKSADLIGASRRVLVSQVAESSESADCISCDLPWLLRAVHDWQ